MTRTHIGNGMIVYHDGPTLDSSTHIVRRESGAEWRWEVSERDEAHPANTWAGWTVVRTEATKRDAVAYVRRRKAEVTA